MTVNSSGSFRAASASSVEPSEQEETVPSKKRKISVAGCSNSAEMMSSTPPSVYSLMAEAADHSGERESPVTSTSASRTVLVNPIPEPKQPGDPSVYSLMVQGQNSPEHDTKSS